MFGDTTGITKRTTSAAAAAYYRRRIICEYIQGTFQKYDDTEY